MVVKVGIMSVIISIVFISCANSMPESHLLPIDDDNDGDYLTDSVEYYFNLDPENPDTDGNNVLDGIQLAKEFYEDIEYLPRYEIGHGPYVIEEIIYGQEICPICGRAINLGRIRVINLLNNLSDTIPFVGLHYLDYGSFRYEGEIHEGEIDPVRLFNILESIKE